MRTPFFSIALFSTALLSMALLTACDGEPPCDRPCYTACDRYEVVACELGCPAGTTETMPACEDAAVPCEKSCWSGCAMASTVACGASCPDGTTETAPTCDAGVPFDAGTDAGAPFSLCMLFTDVEVETAFYDGPPVPEGSYFEAPEDGVILLWGSFSCAESLDVVRLRASDDFGAELLTGVERTTDQFYEVDVMSGETLYHYRMDRCDYFDGGTLAGAPHEDYGALESLVGYAWFRDNHLRSDVALLGGFGTTNASPDVHTWTSCHASQGTGADGCDVLQLVDRTWSIHLDGSVTPPTPRTVRRVPGRCL